MKIEISNTALILSALSKGTIFAKNADFLQKKY